MKKEVPFAALGFGIAAAGDLHCAGRGRAVKGETQLEHLVFLFAL